MKSRNTLLIATRNTGKLRELQQILSDVNYVLTDLMNFPDIQEIPETGETFMANAELKAGGYATQTHLLTLADDSGLEIEELGGAPGVSSARYLGESASFPTRIEALLKQLSKAGPTKRKARFVCAIAIADNEGNILNRSIGTCEGRIALEAQGTGGFGYDPIFIPNGYVLTFAELAPVVKNQISHRARAVEETHQYLQNLTRALHAD